MILLAIKLEGDRMNNFSQFIPKIEQGKFSLQGLYFNDPSNKAKKLYYYPLWGGEYYVKYPYEVDRKYINSFIIFWIEEGELSFNFDNHNDYTATANSVVILDCKERNHYFTKSFCKFIFFHFNGNQIQQLYDYIISTGKNRFTITVEMENQFSQLMKLLKAKISSNKELEYSRLLYGLLLTLTSLAGTRAKTFSETSFHKPPAMIDDVLRYIDKNYNHKITIQNVCHKIGASPSLLTKNFHIYTNNSIHEYLISVRLTHAKKLLTSDSNLSIAEIADICGFHDASHLNKLFHTNLGMTPSEFRNMEL